MVWLGNGNLTVRQSGEKSVAQKRNQNSDRNHQLIHRDHPAADGLRGDFREIERGCEGSDAHRKAEHQTRHDEHLGIRSHRAKKRPDCKQEAAEEESAAAAEFVAEDAAPERADHRAPQERAHDPFNHLVVHPEIALDVDLGTGNHADIQAEEQAGQRRRDANEINDRTDFFGGRGGGHSWKL